jgi:hypothetical protein
VSDGFGIVLSLFGVAIVFRGHTSLRISLAPYRKINDYPQTIAKQENMLAKTFKENSPNVPNENFKASTHP